MTITKLQPKAGHMPTSASIPAVCAVAAIYPAIWNPSEQVNHIGLTIIVLAMIWLTLVIRRLMLAAVAAAVRRNAEEIRDRAIAELTAADDAEWAEMMLPWPGWLEK